jgi:hypothetical protein
MKKITLCVALVGVLLLQIFPSNAQDIVVDRMSNPEYGENLTEYQSLDKQLRFAIDVGYSYRTGKAAEGLPDEYIRKMRSGMNFGVELLYFPSHAWGLGAKYSGRMFDTEMGVAKDNLDLHYFAPLFVGRLFDRQDRNAWVFGLSLGYLSFKEKITQGGNSEAISKGGIGTSYEIGYDIRMSKRNFLGLKLSLTSGFVMIDIPGGERQKENASSLDLSMGFRF